MKFELLFGCLVYVLTSCAAYRRKSAAAVSVSHEDPGQIQTVQLAPPPPVTTKRSLDDPLGVDDAMSPSQDQFRSDVQVQVHFTKYPQQAPLGLTWTLPLQVPVNLDEFLAGPAGYVPKALQTQQPTSNALVTNDVSAYCGSGGCGMLLPWAFESSKPLGLVFSQVQFTSYCIFLDSTKTVLQVQGPIPANTQHVVPSPVNTMYAIVLPKTGITDNWPLEQNDVFTFSLPTNAYRASEQDATRPGLFMTDLNPPSTTGLPL